MTPAEFARAAPRVLALDLEALSDLAVPLRGHPPGSDLAILGTLAHLELARREAVQPGASLDCVGLYFRLLEHFAERVDTWEHFEGHGFGARIAALVRSQPQPKNAPAIAVDGITRRHSPRGNRGR